MNYNLWSKLDQLARDKNQVAQVLLENWDNYSASVLDRQTLSDLIINLGVVPRARDEIEIPRVAVEPLWYDRDMRMLDFRLSGFKAVPTDESYGLRLTSRDRKASDTKIPATFLVLGDNGTAKTTLFSALEYLCVGRTAVGDKLYGSRAVEPVFYHYRGDLAEDFTISVTFADNRQILCRSNAQPNSPEAAGYLKSKIDLTPFFCSESDIAIFECGSNRITDYVDDLLEISEILAVREFLETVRNEMSGEIENAGSEQNKEKSEELAAKTEMVVRVQSEMEALYTSERNALLPMLQSILRTMIAEYIDDDSLIELSENEQGMFDGQLRFRDGSGSIEPRAYFNNFRYKLYLVCIRVAVAFYIMKKQKIAFPILFDDLFDSSDFTNRRSTKDLFAKIFKIYEEQVGLDVPLQLILFTQDEVIAESAYEGITGKVDGNIPDRPVHLVRLFMPKQADEQDRMSRKRKIGFLKGPGVNNQYDFLNLYDTIR